MRTNVMAMVCVLAMSGVALAHEEGDVFLEIVNGRVEIGLISEDGSEIIRGQRVFTAELGADVPNVGGEPGFQSLVGAFDPNGWVQFNFTRAVRRWNGTDFSTLDGSFTAEYGSLSALTPATDVYTPGFQLPVDTNGEFHEHPFWILNAPAADGVYLVSLSFFANNATESDEAWILFGQNVDEPTLDAAADWANANIPAPGAAIPLLALGFGLARRRR
ncbi:MAG: hypothetical protein SFY69_12265 [Planctomycetota bacterium]|nr:hypothetical protein [Planctomycetota bacterium]